LSTFRPQAARRRRLLTRALPIALLGLAAFVAGMIRGADQTDLGRAQAFADGWANRDFRAMYAQLSSSSARHYSLDEFTGDYERAERTATVKQVDAGEASEVDSGEATAASIPVTLTTHAFGQIQRDLVVPLDGGEVAWSPSLVFPGLRSGERLVRHTRVPKRAPILANDGTPLAEGPATARSSPLGTAASAVAGSVSTPHRKQQAELERLGFPPGYPTGTSGLELAFNQRLAGHPGGELVALPAAAGKASGGRTLAATDPIEGKPVHTTIDPDLQQAAVAALGSTYGGVAVLDADDGSVRAVAGIAFSGPQPPGSTFKLITTTAALEDDVVSVDDQFPIETFTTVDGRQIDNAHQEACGGSFTEAFAESCNSVFAPLGPKVGSKDLVGTAESYGFNSPPALYEEGAVEAAGIPSSTLPKSIESDLDLAVTAIGQGEVLATPLEMASVAQTIANGGVREPTSMVTDHSLEASAKPVRVTSSDVTSTLRTLMIGVVTSGTGTAAALPGIEVAGKTGTAELGPVTTGKGAVGSEDQRVDAWFTAFAPAGDPKLAVAAMVVNASGDGGTVAAPIVRSVMASAFGVS
jgi:transpeptidase family protein/MecA-like transpeptidase family protein/penicillin-binding protein